MKKKCAMCLSYFSAPYRKYRFCTKGCERKFNKMTPNERWVHQEKTDTYKPNHSQRLWGVGKRNVNQEYGY